MSNPETEMPNRLAIFACYSEDGYVSPKQVLYIKGLSHVCRTILVVFDTTLEKGEIEKLPDSVHHVITGRHGEYDFGSYKRGYNWVEENLGLASFESVILCNDSCYGPIGSFEPMVLQMERQDVDFWGVTDSFQFEYHLQSYWLCLSQEVARSKEFSSFIRAVKKKANVQEVIKSYELALTRTLHVAGFRSAAFIDGPALISSFPKERYENPLVYPIEMIERGCPLVKTKALRHSRVNFQGVDALIYLIKEKAPDLFEAMQFDPFIRLHEDAAAIRFSVILPTFNRKWRISDAVDSVLAQTHQNFELIIVDDASSDSTSEHIRKTYETEIEDRKIVLVTLEQNLNVCRARNIGLAHAQSDWVAYIDSDNRLRDTSLSIIANAIVEDRDTEWFYGNIRYMKSGRFIGKPFNHEELKKGNYIDNGAVFHKRALSDKFGGYDQGLMRLVDWAFVLKISEHTKPVYIDKVFVDYTDSDDFDRITNSKNMASPFIAIRSAFNDLRSVSTVILSYNQERYIVQAIESALAQKDIPNHEILISDDGSNDGTRDIIKRYASRYPHIINDISSSKNIGISENYKKCFREAVGNAIAILEGDDYWIDEHKNARQYDFLHPNADAKFVFCRTELRNEADGSFRLLRRQDELPSLLSGKDFSEDPYLNPIANLSTLMIRSQFAKTLPNFLFEPRFNEICLAFYADLTGKIGFQNTVSNIYRKHEGGTWSGGKTIDRFQSEIAIRENALRIARSEYRASIQAAIDKRTKLLESAKAREADMLLQD